MEIIWSPRFERLAEEELPPVWSELVQREVTTRSLEVWRIDDAEYVRMRGPDARRLSIPVDAGVGALGELGLEAGRYMLIARDRSGRIEGRRPFELRPPRSSSLREPRSPTAEERLQAELAEARKRLRDMKHDLDLAQRQIEVAKVRTERAELQRDQAQRRLSETTPVNAVPRRVLVEGPADDDIGDHDDEQGEQDPAVRPPAPREPRKVKGRRSCRRRPSRVREKARAEPTHNELEQWLPVFEKAVDVFRRLNEGPRPSSEGEDTRGG